MPRILVIEDNDAVRRMVGRVLVDEGYEVQEAADGSAGLNAYREQPSDLVITDIVMPRMGGRELVERVLAVRPKIRALYLSGYTDEAVMRHGVLQAGSAFLQKPFTARQLMTKVRQILDV